MRRTLIAVLALLLAPAALLAQPPAGRGGMGPGPGMMNNIARVLIEHREDLKLTDVQVAALTEIGDALEEKNGPYIQEMRKMRESGTTMRDMSQDERAAMRETMQKVRDNNRQAHEEINAVLDDEQQKKADELLASMRPGRGRRGGMRH